jgi:integrase
MPGAPTPDGWPGTKNAASHRVWLPAPAQALLAELLDHDVSTGFVFTGSRATPISGLDAAMRSICARLGVERVTPHDLRRSHGTRLTALGFGRDAMNRIQNHKEGGIASIYDRHGYSQETKHVMEAVASGIMSVVKGDSQIDNILSFERSVLKFTG